VQEETGLDVDLGDPLPEIRYEDQRGRPKVVRYWVMRPLDEGSDFVPNHEVDEIRWCTIDDAREQLSYAHDRDLMATVRV
jgi:8-oxo-dGTP pyrophosphatase MutT (NUDIX family)